MDVFEIRLRNLRELCGDERGARKDMADRLQMSESQLSQLIGKTPSKNIGDGLARTIEGRLKLARGYMDTLNHDLSQDSVDFAKEFQGLNETDKRFLRDLLKKLRK